MSDQRQARKPVRSRQACTKCGESRPGTTHPSPTSGVRICRDCDAEKGIEDVCPICGKSSAAIHRHHEDGRINGVPVSTRISNMCVCCHILLHRQEIALKPFYAGKPRPELLAACKRLVMEMQHRMFGDAQ